jgi:hypothetical protein
MGERLAPFFTCRPCGRPASASASVLPPSPSVLLWTLSPFSKLLSLERPLTCRKFQVSPKPPFFSLGIVGTLLHRSYGRHTTLLCPSSGVLLEPCCGPFRETRTHPTLHRRELSGTFWKNTPVRSGNDRWGVVRRCVWMCVDVCGRTVGRPLSYCSRVFRRFMSSGIRV